MQTFVVLALCVVVSSALPQSNSLLEEIKKELLRELAEKKSTTVDFGSLGIDLDQNGGSPDKLSIFVERKLTIVPTDLGEVHSLQLTPDEMIYIELNMIYGSCSPVEYFSTFTVEGKKYVCSSKGSDTLKALAAPERHSQEVVLVQKLAGGYQQPVHYLVVHCTDDNDACQQWFETKRWKIRFALYN